LADFTKYHASLGSIDVIYHEGEGASHRTQALPHKPPKTDTGQNPNEDLPEYGDFFAQGDFSGGMGQALYHWPKSDETRFYAGDGLEITEDGIAKCATTALTDTDIGSGSGARILEIADGELFLAFDAVFKRTTDLATWTDDDPVAGTGVNIGDSTSEGSRLYACVGVDGVHLRSAAGTWAPYQPDGATNLTAGTVTKLLWAKDRLFAVGGTNSRSFYEVTTDSTPTALRTLPEGWAFQKPFELGPYIYVPAVASDGQQSRIYRFGLNAAASAIEEKGYTEMPRGTLIYVGIGHLGLAFLGGGRRTTQGGFDPVFYQAFPDAEGDLTFALIAKGSGSGTQSLYVQAMATIGERVYLGWSLASGSPFGARDGIAYYDPARAAFVLSTYRSAGGTNRRVLDVIGFDNKIVWTTTQDLYFDNPEDNGPGGNTGNYNTGTLITSIADRHNAGLKVWDRFEWSFKTISFDETVACYYSTKHPKENTWTLVGTGSTGKTKEVVLTTPVESEKLALKFVLTPSTGGGIVNTELHSYTVRSNPTVATKQFVLERTVRVAHRDRKDGPSGTAPVVYNNTPDSVKDSIEDLLDDWITLTEQDKTYRVQVKSFETNKVAHPEFSQTQGNPRKNVYLIRLLMVGNRTA